MKWKPLPLREENRRSLFRGPHEPTLPREPLEVWTVPDTPQTLERVLASFAQFFTKADLNRLDACPTSAT